MRTIGRLVVGLLAVALIAPVSAGASPIDRTPTRVLDNALTIGHLFAIDNLNPFIGFSNEAYLLYSLVYDYLFSLDQDQNYVPNIATRSSTPDDGSTWVYTIRRGVKWHDGENLTADDVAFTINYNIQAFWQLWAYQPYLNQVKQCPFAQAPDCGAKVTGPWEVTIYFQRPFSPGSAAIVVPIIQKKQWENITAQQAQYSFPNPNPIGTGPYKADPDIYSQWFSKEPIVLHRNPDYHFGAPSVQRVIFRLFDAETSMVAALQRGDIDVAMLSASGADQVRALAMAGVELQEGITIIQYWIDIGITQLNDLGVNLRLNPARFDLAVRQAMAHGTDKDFILRQFYGGKGLVGSTLVSPVATFWHYEPTVEKFEYSLEKANAFLDAAGYDTRDSATGIRRATADKTLQVYCSPENVRLGGCDTNISVPQGTPLRFTMVTRSEAPEERLMAEYLKQNWAQIGIELAITTELELAMNTDVYGGEFDTYIWWWSADADPNYILSIQTNFTLNGWSDNFYDNKTYNDLYLAQLSELDGDARRQLVHEAQKVHYMSAPFIILVYPYYQYAWWTDEYIGWGDMNINPGRQLGAFWGNHPLFADLTHRNGPFVSLHGASGRPGQPITIAGSILDAMPGRWHLRFGDGAVASGTYANGTTTLAEPHVFPAAGEYLAVLSVDNGEQNVTRANVVRVEVSGNLPPSVVSFGATPREAKAGDPVSFQASARDPEGGTLTFAIDYGDGSPIETRQATAAPDEIANVSFAHAYARGGSLPATVTVSDGNRSSSKSSTIVVLTPVAASGALPIWIGIVAGVVAAAVAAAVGVVTWKRRKSEKAPPEILPPQPPVP